MLGADDVFVVSNDFRGNRGIDCLDDTTGAGTGGTVTHWESYQGDEAQPAAICT